MGGVTITGSTDVVASGHPSPAASVAESAPAEALRSVGAPTRFADAATAVSEQLWHQFDGLLPAAVINDYVNRAVHDLTRSISIEALPEMAAQLANVRLHEYLHRTLITGDVPIVVSPDLDGADRRDSGKRSRPHPPNHVSASHRRWSSAPHRRAERSHEGP